MNRISIIASVFLFGVGIAISQAGLRRVDFSSYAMNTFAVRQSGYGMMMARLSQDTVNRVWHQGVEASDHDHSKCDNPDHHHGDDHGHDHSGHQHEGFSFTSMIEGIHGRLEGMSNAKGARTSRFAMTKRHKLQAKREIESTLKRSYRMDPTNYGVYNAYYLFLTIHNYGATESDKRKARLLSEHTISQANREAENPEAWLTAASASLNLFFTEQGKRKIAGTELTQNELKKFRNQLGGCLGNFSKVVQKREEEGTWELISGVRRAEMLERARFAGKTFEQFDAMLKRVAVNDQNPVAGPAEKLAGNIINE